MLGPGSQTGLKQCLHIVKLGLTVFLGCGAITAVLPHGHLISRHHIGQTLAKQRQWCQRTHDRALELVGIGMRRAGGRWEQDLRRMLTGMVM